MSYIDFTLQDLRKKFDIKETRTTLFEAIQPVEITGAFGIDLPILALVEAKKNDLDLRIIQCATQMIGAQVFNEQNDQNIPVIYGCVTTADAWQFLRLENKELKIDLDKYYLVEIEKIIGVFQNIIDYYKKILG